MAVTKKTDDRYEQTALGEIKIDREAGVLNGVHIMGRFSRHGYEYGLPAQRAVATKWPGMLVGLGHNYDSSPMRVEQAWGEIIEPITVDDRGTWGSLRFLKSHPLTEQILEAAEKKMRFGLSAVTRVGREQNKVVTEFMPTRLDVVVDPATCETFFEQSTQGDSNMEPEEKPEPTTTEEHTAAALHSALDAVLADDSSGKDKAKKLAKIIKAMHDEEEEAEDTAVTQEPAAVEAAEPGSEAVEKPAAAEGKTEKTEAEIKAEEDEAASKRTEQSVSKAEYQALAQRFEQLQTKTVELEKRMILREQFIEPKSTLQQTIEKTTAKIDMSKFWNS